MGIANNTNKGKVSKPVDATEFHQIQKQISEKKLIVLKPYKNMFNKVKKRKDECFGR